MDKHTGLDNWSFEPGETDDDHLSNSPTTIRQTNEWDNDNPDQAPKQTPDDGQNPKQSPDNGHNTNTKQSPDVGHDYTTPKKPEDDHGYVDSNTPSEFDEGQGHDQTYSQEKINGGYELEQIHIANNVKVDDDLFAPDQQRQKVRRHHTDLPQLKTKRPTMGNTNDVIVEDDYDISNEPIKLQRPPKKKPAVVARHHTEVLRKRTMTPVSKSSIDADAVVVTRRSISRHGSRAQQMSRLQCIGEDSEETTNVLKSRQTDSFLETKANIARESNHRLRNFKQAFESNQQHVHTHAFDQAKKLLESKHVLLISGPKDSGKTHTAMKLVETIVNLHPETVPLIFDHARDLRMLNDLSSKAVVFVDDVLGKWRMMSDCLLELGTVWNNLQFLIEHTKIYVILTCDSSYLHDIQKSKDSVLIDRLISHECMIGLDTEKYKLTKDEKTRFFRMIGKRSHSSFKSSEIEKLVSSEESKYGCPSLCWLLSIGASADDLEGGTIDGYLHEHLTKILNTDIQKYITLVMILVFDGRLSMSKFSVLDKTILDRLAALFDADEEIINEASMKVFAKKLVGKYLTKDPDTHLYIMYNDFIAETLATQMLHNHGERAIKVLPLDILAGLNVGNQDETDNDNLNSVFCKFVLRPKNYKCLAERFKEVISTGNPDFLTMSSFPVWEDDAFSEIALTIMGVDDFIIRKEGGLTLLAALSQSNRISTIDKIVNYMTKYRHDALKDKESEMKDAIKSACRSKHDTVVNLLTRCFKDIDDDIMIAAAEGGSDEIIQNLQKLGGQIFDRKGIVMKQLCKHGHDDIVKRILAENSGNSLLNKKGHKGNTLLHSVATSPRSALVETLIRLGGDPEVSSREAVTTLHVSSDYGRLETVKLLADRFPDLLTLTDNRGFTAAHCAAREGHLDVVRYLIEHNVPGDILLSRSNTILHLAAYNGHTDVLRLLWKKYPGLTKAQNNESFTAPQIAARMGHVDTLQFCIQAGVSPESKTVDGRTFLHLAAFNGQLDMVKHLCNRYRKLIEITDTDGNTVAHDAAASGNVHVIDYILQKGHISLSSLSNDGCSVLHDACYYGRIDISMYLVDKGPGLINMKTTSGYTPCHGVALGGFVDLFKALVSKGADPMMLSDDNSTVLHEAAFSGKFEMVKYLCVTYPNLITYRNKMDYTATHFAAQEGHLDMFAYLLSVTNDPSCKTGENQTYLHVAAYNNRLDVVKYICEHFPELTNLLDTTGAAPLHYAARGGSVEICGYLIGKRVDPCIKTSSGSTILHLACYDGKLELVRYLCQNYPGLVNELDETGHNAAHYAAGSGSIELLGYVLGTDIDSMSRTENGSTMLLKAAYNGHIEMVKYICNKYPEMMRITDNFGCNLAHYAVCAGNEHVLMYALEGTIDPMGVTSEGHTLLHIAAFHGQIHLVKYLCETFPEIRNIKDYQELTPEDYAKQGNQDFVIQYLESINRKQEPEIEEIKDIDESYEENGACQPCRECMVTCFRCHCSRDYALNVIHGVWRRIIGLICVCRRN